MSRRPSSERIRLPAIDTRIRVQCRSCLGDGWSYPMFGARRHKLHCHCCAGTGIVEIFLIEKRPADVMIGEEVKRG